MAQLAEFIGNHLLMSLAFMTVLFLYIIISLSEKMQAFSNINPTQLTQLVNHQNAIVIDTRSEDEFQNGHIVNAINMPLNELISGSANTSQLKGKTIIAYCKSGISSKSACKHLLKSDVENVFSLSGGITSWINEKLPIVKK